MKLLNILYMFSESNFLVLKCLMYNKLLLIVCLGRCYDVYELYMVS